MAKTNKTQTEGRRKDPALRKKALRLRDRGKTSQEIAAELAVSVGSVKAWLAHQTRGTYDL